MARYVRQQITFCGENAKSANYAEVDFYPITEKQAKSTARAKKAQVTSEMQAKRNAETARRNLVQKLNTNFTNDDYTGVLCYDENNLPKNQKQATRDFRNFIRKVQARCKKRGLEKAKYVCVTEHQELDEENGIKMVRFHHHVIISCGLSRDELEEIWGQGIATSFKRLKFDKSSIEGLANYILKYPKRKHRYHYSRGLKNPYRPRPNDGVLTRTKIDKMMRDGRAYDKHWWSEFIANKTGDVWNISEVCVKYTDCAENSGIGEAGFRIYIKMHRPQGANSKGEVRIHGN